jgi:16S rRNA (cytosine967-C5)-methyltransferase
MADAARLAAYDVLRAVRVDDAYANLVLPQVLRRHRLSGRDAAFATELASGTLRRQGSYDAVVDACLDRGKVQPRVRDVLRLGAHQLLGMRVDDHAAVSATVDLARARAGPRSAGLVNAVLRRIAVDDLDTWLARVAPDEAQDPLGHAAVVHSHPRWVVEAFAEALGERRAELPDLLAADNAPPRVVLVARPGRADVAELPGEPTALSPYGVVLAGGDPGAVPAVAEGRAGVQDEGSQLVALALAAAQVEGDDRRWLDLCAGPGGKAALLAALASGRGARLVANERQPHRAELVTRALAGADGVEAVTTHDGTRPPWPAASFDRVLVDAPCSGLGALRRRPEARWRRRPDDLRELVPLQRSLLDAAVTLVRPGGVVLYATCSPVVAETSDVLSAVLVSRDDVRLEPVPLALPDAAATLAGTAQLWPHRHGTDAMFLGLLRRV